MEQARRPALADSDHRIARMGARVLINGTWYNMASGLLPKSPVSSSLCDEVPHIFIPKSHLEPREFLISSAKRLLQQYLPITDSCTAADTILIRSPLRPRRAAFRYTQRRRLASSRIGRMFSRQHRSLSMAKGTVKWFNPTKAYGFIQPASGGGKDVFVHISAFEKAGLSTLNEGQTVEYEEVPNKGKTSAENLKVV